MALPHAITERRQFCRGTRRHRVAPRARGRATLVLTHTAHGRAVLGLPRCFLGSRRSLQLGIFDDMPPSQMRAIRPNAGHGAAAAVLPTGRHGRPTPWRARPTRPNPSLHPTCSSRLRRLPHAGELQRWAEYQYQARKRRSVRLAAIERFDRVPREVSALIEEEGAHTECWAEVSAAAAPVALRRARPVALWSCACLPSAVDA